MLPPVWRGQISLMAQAPEEFESALPAMYVDIALDGIIFHDPKGYADERLAYLRQLIRERGLRRERIGRDFAWRRKRFPGIGWFLEWEHTERRQLG
jgi:hypothetical protein